VLVCVLVSHPFCRLPSQLANPGLHVGAQLPATHVAPPFAFVHACPHAPQCAVVVDVLVSQPFAAKPSQLPKPAAQAMEHAPSAQPGVPFTVEQARPHPPQCATLVSVLISQPFAAVASQLSRPGSHADTVQAPPAHCSVAKGRLHAAPQAPQLPRLIVRFVSQPFPANPSQLPRPGSQVETPHTALTQFGVPPVLEQTLAHVPQ
jgi:hypothetical protein